MRRHASVSFKRARLVLVAADRCGLTDAIGRLGVASVARAPDFETARTLCEAADACVVVVPRTVPDERPPWGAETEAPGRGRIPTLLIAEAVTPFVRLAARRAGYRMVISRKLPHRMLYRSVGALLQGVRMDDEEGAGNRPPSGEFRVLGREFAGFGKLKLQ